MAEPNPIDDEDLFDMIEVDGLQSPGFATITGHDREYGWDVKKAQGQTGATITRTLEDLIEFKVKFHLIDYDDFDAWPAFQAVLEQSVKRAKTVHALKIYHPDLARNGITSVVVKTIGGVEHDGQGGQFVTVTFLEYKPPQKKKPAGPDPNQKELDEIAKLTKKYQETPWG